MATSSDMHLAIWTRHNIGSAKTAEQFLKTLSALFPLAFPPRWGQYEPLTVTASPDDYSKVVALWSNVARETEAEAKQDSSIACGSFLGSARSRGYVSVEFWAGALRRPQQVWFDFSEKFVDSATTQEHVVTLFSRWVNVLHADLGLFCTEAEWRSKNMIIPYVEPDGSESAFKVFGLDITQGLPGVYWCTYFGPAFAEWLGANKLSKAPWPFVEQVADGYLLRRSDRPKQWETEKKLDKALITYLGRERFFDIKFPDRPIDHLEIPVPPYSQGPEG